jgi:hypothetical protein
MSLAIAVDRCTLIEQELNNQVVPKIWPGYLDANRPTSACGTNGIDKGTPSTQRGSTTGNLAEEDVDARTCPINFSLSLSPANLEQIQGSIGLANVIVTFLSGSPAEVTISARGVPAATEILFAPTSGRPSFSSSMTIATQAETPLGRFNITVLARGGGLEKSAILSLEILPFLQVIPPIHDIAIVSASVPETATVGNIVLINATISNLGSVTENFDLQAYANTTRVADQMVLNLAPAATDMTRLVWNTTAYSPGTYTIVVVVPPVQGELGLLDNSREAGQIILSRNPGSGPGPSPAASGNGQGFIYGRQLAILAAIAEAAIVFLAVLRSKGKGSTGNASAESRMI